MSIAPRINPKRIAREIALLSLAQLQSTSGSKTKDEFKELVLAAIRTLREEVHETLETAALEVKKSNDRLSESETQSTSLTTTKSMLTEAVQLTQKAINRLGAAVEIPELIERSSSIELREYTLEIVSCVHRRGKEINELLESVMVDWQLNRVAKIDRDILQIAVVEIVYLKLPEKIVINEAVELAKRYSDEDGYRFINGVLRRVTDKIKREKIEIKE
jgi:N utilization substance protein B